VSDGEEEVHHLLLGVEDKIREAFTNMMAD
jgi:hypothetical protein